LLGFEAKAGGQPPDPRDTPRMRMRAVVLCGPGNNGGDGFVVARLLQGRGWDVEVFLYGDAEKLPPDARVNYERWLEIGAVARLVDDRFDGWPDIDSGVHVILDALFGTGLTRPFLDCRYVAMTLNSCSSLAEKTTFGLPVYRFPKVVAVDVPSGLCADSGIWLGDDQPLDFANLANLTVTFHSRKRGHVLVNGPESCGRVVVKDIGLGHADMGAQVSRQTFASLSGERRLGRVASREVVVDDLSADIKNQSQGHKFSHGHALILSGGSGKTGAARVAARGALRIGSGLVTLGAPPNAQQEVACQITALMLQRVGDAQAFEKKSGG